MLCLGAMLTIKSDFEASPFYLTINLLIPQFVHFVRNRRRVQNRLWFDLRTVCNRALFEQKTSGQGRPRFALSPSTVLGLLPITVSTGIGNRISYRGRFYSDAKPSSVRKDGLSFVDI